MFTDLLVHEVAVYRRSGRSDRFGQPVDINPGQITGPATATYPCRIYTKSGGLVNMERSRDVFEDLRRIFTAPDADIQEDDALQVTDPLTDVVLLPMAKVKLKQIVYARGEPHHLEIDVIVQRGPQ